MLDHIDSRVGIRADTQGYRWVHSSTYDFCTSIQCEKIPTFGAQSWSCAVKFYFSTGIMINFRGNWDHLRSARLKQGKGWNRVAYCPIFRSWMNPTSRPIFLGESLRTSLPLKLHHSGFQNAGLRTRRASPSSSEKHWERGRNIRTSRINQLPAQYPWFPLPRRTKCPPKVPRSPSQDLWTTNASW